MKLLEGIWGQWIEIHRDCPSFRNDAGIVVATDDGETAAQENLLNLDALPAEAGESEGLEFKRGDEVKTVRRLSWKVAVPGAEPTKVDILEGAVGGNNKCQ